MLLGGVVALLAAAPGASAGPTPGALYRKLVANEVPGTFLPAGVVLAVNRVRKLSTEARNHHAVGAVEMDFAGGKGPSGGWVFTIFKNAADAKAAWRALPTPTPGGTSSTIGGQGAPAVLYTGASNGKSYADVRILELGVVVQANPSPRASSAAARSAALSFAHNALAYLRTLTR